MDANDIAKAIELGKSLEDLKALKRDVQDAKQEKARLEKNIAILEIVLGCIVYVGALGWQAADEH